ncbi:MotA/TolQ/ExbB proton channel family protein [Chromobacterium vaccinii]|uniref:Biopolymer transport protein ExbB n=1 Tax=Chromobacterium vaccinii TaxID=1108595 RepID=A0A1D9LHY8_9NEIS|nr:MotA/TolQ/ExbB proton channel family protein [Chromobacterium vaccinii]AOZ50896.1 biopolymer transporter ExbB [Chromobacterium vaccinii]MCD4498601.1 MotA/TolQ/ExbB proton channel family protein [Chromobacterium vaccinii]QND82663.1 MotA/TolQ/ExbB proton channel family protein [Chromobacterium vaccinii]QND87893.1 MotA/TolQ/ExbB proton channel family protein [Chromobacterium vaccinii]SUX29799.1 colicin uptake protein TolQ [Chromobacterium vaccinii]
MNVLSVFQQGDAVLIAVFMILILMSVLTWYLIIVRGVQTLRLRRANREAENALWGAADWRQAETSLQHSQGQFANLARAGLAALKQYQSQAGRALGQACGVDEFLTRAIRKVLSQEMARQEAGLTVLASIGSTAPFVGLFGTVWGIYHALVNIGQAGQMSIGAVAGPIGEALVATAAGLAAAIPAVLAYNALTRAQRVMSQELDYFAHDLHAQLLTQSGESHGVR